MCKLSSHSPSGRQPKCLSFGLVSESASHDSFCISFRCASLNPETKLTHTYPSMKEEGQDNHCEHSCLKIERLGSCGNLYISDQ